MDEKLAWPSSQAGFCMSFAHAVKNHVMNRGGDVNLVMQAMQCASPSSTTGAAQRVQAQQLDAGLNAAAHMLDDEHLGLRVGMDMTPSHLGALGHAAMTASDGISGLQLYEELQQLCMTEMAMRHHRQGSLVKVHSEGMDFPCLGYTFWSFILACRLNFIRSACGRWVTPAQVNLPCMPPRCERPLTDFVGGPLVQFQAPRYAESFQVSCLHAPNPHGRAEIHRVMATMAHREWRELFDADEWLMGRLKQAMLHALDRGENPTLSSMVAWLTQREKAVDVAISVRQLQRKLTARAQSFRSLLGEVRRERALAQLRLTNRPLADIAVEAGYAELSSFHRAVRRWTGLTPMRIRQEGEGCLET